MVETAAGPITIASINHHNAVTSEIESFRFHDEKEFLADARTRFRGAYLLQTCNRVEVLVQGDEDALSGYLESLGRSGYTIYTNNEALEHLLRLASGLDSMIVGEDQILGQMKQSLSLAQETGATGRFIDICINKAVHVGAKIRKATMINKGAVSVGSAAVELAESKLGTLDDRHILVVGSGEMGQLVARALAARKLKAIYVTNRSFDRALMLADKIGGKAVKFDDIYRYISISDVVITCTAAPHPVIHAEFLREAMEERVWPLDEHPSPVIMIDIAQPRDVEEGVSSIDGIHLFTIDSLRTVSGQNMDARRAEAGKAEDMIMEELEHFVRLLRRTVAEDPIADLYSWADRIRTRERDRAVARIGNGDDRIEGIIDDFSRVMIKKLLSDLTVSIRECAEKGNYPEAEALVKSITRGGQLPCGGGDADKPEI